MKKTRGLYHVFEMRYLNFSSRTFLKILVIHTGCKFSLFKIKKITENTVYSRKVLKNIIMRSLEEHTNFLKNCYFNHFKLYLFTVLEISIQPSPSRSGLKVCKGSPFFKGAIKKNEAIVN
jgi:hypothetical protein